MFRNSQTDTLLTFFVLKNVTNSCRPCLIRNSNANVSLQNVTIKPASKCTFVVFNNLKNLHFMNKAELIEALADKTGLQKQEAKKVLDAYTEIGRAHV